MLSGSLPPLFLGSGVNLVIDPPVRERVSGCAEQCIVPETDTPVYLLVDVVAGQHLVSVQPAANATHLQPIAQPARERSGGVAITNA
jgi:hypothetical protein